MRSLILCEGFDDVLIIGYYLHKTGGWNYDPNVIFSNLYDFPRMHKKHQIVEIYKKENNLLGIWAVGGKDSFAMAYKFIAQINSMYPQQGIEQLFIIGDRDEDEIDTCTDSIKRLLNDYGIKIQKLKNNQVNSYFYEVEEEHYCLKIVPVILPFEKEGALETVLLEAISETSEEDQYIVKCAEGYVENILTSGRLHKYLRHDRLVLKAKLSAAVSITNPDRSTALFDKVLMSWDWHQKDAVKKHFGMIEKLLDE